MMQEYRICQRCIMDSTDPDIEFDENGYCNHCRNYFVRVEHEVYPGQEGKRRLHAIVEKMKEAGKGKDYNCIIGVSGGVDSTYVAYAVKKLGLNPIAVHFDNGWNAELAVDNIKRVLDTLKIDLFTFVVDWEEFKDLQISFLRASVPNAEIPTDHGINALLFDTALKHNIKYIIMGGNVATEGIMPFRWGYYNHDLRHLKAIHKRFGTIPLRTMPQISLAKYLYSVFVKGIRILPILNYLNFKKSEAIKVLHNELGWRSYGSKHFESIYTRFYQGYILPKKFGFDKRKAHLSCLICAGELSREDALEEMKKDHYDGYNLREDMEFVIKKLNMSEAEFEAIMKQPPVDYSQYSSNDLIYYKLAHLRARFKKMVTTV